MMVGCSAGLQQHRMARTGMGVLNQSRMWCRACRVITVRNSASGSLRLCECGVGERVHVVKLVTTIVRTHWFKLVVTHACWSKSDKCKWSKRRVHTTTALYRAASHDIFLVFRVAPCISQRPRRSRRRCPPRHLVRLNEVRQVCNAFYDGDIQISIQPWCVSDGKPRSSGADIVDHVTRHWRPQSWVSCRLQWRIFPHHVLASGCGAPRTYGKQRPACENNVCGDVMVAGSNAPLLRASLECLVQ